jgi:hypothetical protein
VIGAVLAGGGPADGQEIDYLPLDDMPQIVVPHCMHCGHVNPTRYRYRNAGPREDGAIVYLFDGEVPR